jgi:death-on-curing protein|tara:strand:+ start:440 stop:646 length:207 start_codon:yes stop_codon:yes gene_type:complete
MWLVGKAVLALHDIQLSEHGGSSEINDQGALESALVRPVNQALYSDPDHAALAAAYVFEIAKNHSFVD